MMLPEALDQTGAPLLAAGETLVFTLPLLFGLFLLTFPTGRLTGRPRRVGVYFMGGVTLLLMADAWFVNATIELADGSTISNPFVAGWAQPLRLWGDMLAWIGLAFILAALVDLVLRFRKSAGLVRQQFKWLTATVIVFPAVAIPFALLQEILGLSYTTAVVLFAVGVNMVAISVGVAVLKHRLFEVDRLVSRAVGYSLTVGFFAAAFGLGAIWLPTKVLDAPSPVVVAGTTLAVAALFNPVRKKIRTWVDGRFYRSRIDGELVSAALTVQLRNPLDPDELASKWQTLVAETFQPVCAAVWVQNAK
jgi:hypothetical protein